MVVKLITLVGGLLAVALLLCAMAGWALLIPLAALYFLHRSFRRGFKLPRGLAVMAQARHRRRTGLRGRA